MRSDEKDKLRYAILSAFSPHPNKNMIKTLFQEIFTKCNWTNTNDQILTNSAA